MGGLILVSFSMKRWEVYFLLLRTLSIFDHVVGAEQIPLHGHNLVDNTESGPEIEAKGRKLHGRFLHITGNGMIGFLPFPNWILLITNSSRP